MSFDPKFISAQNIASPRPRVRMGISSLPRPHKTKNPISNNAKLPRKLFLISL